MTRTAPTRTTALTIGLGALLVPVVAPGVAHADPDHWRWMREPAPPVTSELLARGEAGEFSVRNEKTGFLAKAEKSTDVAFVRATLAPRESTKWHEHAGDSFVVVHSGRLRMVEPDHRDHEGCMRETFRAGEAFAHPAGPHDFQNPDDEPAVFYIVYFVPEGASPAPIPVDAPRGC